MLPLSPLATLLIFIPVGFLCGSVPMSLLLGLARGIDIRTMGSHNIGATNLGRALGTKWFLAGFLLDAVKGLLPMALSGWLAGILGGGGGGGLNPEPALTWAWLGVLIATVMGHMFSPWVGFKGGKGVATSFGAMLGAFPILTYPALAALLIWAVVLGISRFMGLASSAAALTLPVAAAAINTTQGRDHLDALPVYIITSVLAVAVIAKHRGNLARTLAGTEPRFGAKQDHKPDSRADKSE